MIALEVPTGSVADRIGRRNCPAPGMGAMTLSLGGFVFAVALLEYARDRGPVVDPT
ncbi:hypothetical protein [Natronococcus wangiae]|uniref:hypothetical protein n=1 Tax=Natronococcus wangiae TaxID=3068275 RepID=UPI00273EDAFE|nr:hypothetical protein [Natronococcus sp. AD5]